MLATVCLLAMTGVSFVPDRQLESDSAKAVFVGEGKTFVLLEQSGAINLHRLPHGLQERVRREFSLSESYQPDPAAKRLRDLVKPAPEEQGRDNPVLVLPPVLDYLSPMDSVPYMPNFYRKGDPLPYIPNFFREGDPIPYIPNFFHFGAPIQFLPPAGVRHDEQILKGLWDRFEERLTATQRKSGDKHP